jgi:hypothetical protein
MQIKNQGNILYHGLVNIIKVYYHRILSPLERQEVVGELNLESPVVVNRRRRAGQEAGRELRESV